MDFKTLFFICALLLAAAGAPSCSPPCAPGLCCSEWGYCGTGSAYCGNVTSPPPPPPTEIPPPHAPPSGGKGRIAAYWGQHDGEGDLVEVCNSGKYEIILLAFLATFGNFLHPVIDLSNHCNPTNGGCIVLSGQIQACQAKGIEVLLSLGGGASGGYLVSDDDAKDLAKSLWNSYLGGNSSDRPLGPAALDGIDLDIEAGGIPQRYAVLVKSLRGLAGGSKILISAAPQCPYPDLNLGVAVQTPGLFDYLFVQFYNNYCGYNGATTGLLDSWKQWTTGVASAKIFLGLPASPSAANTGFVPVEVCKSGLLPMIKGSGNYGGVMFWSVYWDEQDNYSSQIRSNV